MTKFILGLMMGILLVPAAVYFYFRSGRVPVATSASPMPMEILLAKAAIRARLRAEATQTAPIGPDKATLLAGVRIYRQNCAVCHGVPDQRPTDIAKGMFPQPPQLFQSQSMVTDDPVGETFWKAKNGIRMTGMPGFQASLSDEQLWQVSLLVANADKLPPAVLQVLTAPTAK